MKNEFILLFDLTTRAYVPSTSYLLFVGGIVASFVFVLVKKKKEFSENKGKILAFYSVAISFFVINISADYMGFAENIAQYESNDYETLEGTVDYVESYPTKTYQIMQISGIKFFTKKGGTNSFSERFSDHFASGDYVKLEYVNQDDGIIKIFTKKESLNEES
jgi:hypothetical protein